MNNMKFQNAEVVDIKKIGEWENRGDWSANFNVSLRVGEEMLTASVSQPVGHAEPDSSIQQRVESAIGLPDKDTLIGVLRLCGDELLKGNHKIAPVLKLDTKTLPRIVSVAVENLPAAQIIRDGLPTLVARPPRFHFRRLPSEQIFDMLLSRAGGEKATLG